MIITGMAVAAVFMFLLTYGESLADDVQQKYGRLKGHAVRAALLIAPTVALGVFNWKLAAAGWVLRAIMAGLMALFFARIYTPRDPKQLPIEELECALETGLTGEALANDIAARRAAHLAKLGVSTKP
jgi:hypothetical protein